MGAPQVLNLNKLFLPEYLHQCKKSSTFGRRLGSANSPKVRSQNAAHTQESRVCAFFRHAPSPAGWVPSEKKDKDFG